MALKSYKPTTPSQRNLVIVDRTGLYRGKPVKSLVEGQNSTGGRNNHGRITSRFRGGGHKQAYRTIDFKRVAPRRGRDRRAHRIRSEPHRLHRAGEVQGRRADLHPGAAAAVGRRQHRRGRERRHQARQRHAARQHAGRHDRAQRRAQGRQGRADRALGRHLRPDRRPRRRVRHPASQLGRAAPGAWPLPCAPSARCRTPTT